MSSSRFPSEIGFRVIMQITTNRGLEYISVLLCPKEKNIGGWHSIGHGLDWPPRHATPSADCHSYAAQSAEKLLPIPLSRRIHDLLPCTAALLQVNRLRSGLECASVEGRAAVQAGEPSLVEVEVAPSGVYRDAVDLALLARGVGVSDLHALAASVLIVGSPGCGDDAVVVLEDVDEVLILWGRTLAGFEALVLLGLGRLLRSSRGCRWGRQSSRSRRS